MLADLTWLVDVLPPVREVRLDLLDRSVLIASGALISLPPFETSLVCRLGEALLIDGLRGIGGTTSSFSGDGARCGLVEACAL